VSTCFAKILKKTLQLWLKERGLKIPAFAELVGIPYGTVYGYVRGDRNPTAEFLQLAAKKLEISLEDILLDVEGAPHESGPEYRSPLPAADLLRLLDGELVERIYECLTRQMPGAENGRARELIAATNVMIEERERRKNAGKKMEVKK
jgi:transcriptional regulator with XRE-family HTH domain